MGVTAGVQGMTRDVKLMAFRELRDRLHDGSLVLPQHDSLSDELARVQLKLEQGGPKVILPRSARGHCDMAQALALCAYRVRWLVDRPRPQTMDLDKARVTITGAAMGGPPRDPDRRTSGPRRRGGAAAGRSWTRSSDVDPDPDTLLRALDVAQHGRRSRRRLTHLQTVTAEMIDAGYSNAEIAAKLGVSTRSVTRYAAVALELQGCRRPRGRPRK